MTDTEWCAGDDVAPGNLVRNTIVAGCWAIISPSTVDGWGWSVINPDGKVIAFGDLLADEAAAKTAVETWETLETAFIAQQEAGGD